MGSSASPPCEGRECVFWPLQFLQQVQLIYLPARHPWLNSVRRDWSPGRLLWGPVWCICWNPGESRGVQMGTRWALTCPRQCALGCPSEMRTREGSHRTHAR